MIEHTSRGLRVYADLIDRYGRRVRVAESSLATEHCVWIQTGGANAHLNVADARAVRDALDTFLAEPWWAEGREELDQS